jgi:hypothetical protein
MPRTPDSRDGELFEDQSILLEEKTTDPVDVGEIKNVLGAVKIKDTVGIYDPRALHSLIHFINEGPADGFASGAYKEVLPSANPFPTSVIWWISVAKLKKIVEKTITYTGAFPTTIVWKSYADDGVTVLVTVSDSISYSGSFEITRTRTIS